LVPIITSRSLGMEFFASCIMGLTVTWTGDVPHHSTASYQGQDLIRAEGRGKWEDDIKMSLMT